MSANDGQADVVLVYDDLTKLIVSVIVRNDGSGTFTASLRDTLTDLVVFGPETRTDGSGASTTNISLLGYLVVSLAGVLDYPLLITATWTA